MRINTAASMLLAKQALLKYGSWRKVFKAAKKSANGTYVLPSEKASDTHENT